MAKPGGNGEMNERLLEILHDLQADGDRMQQLLIAHHQFLREHEAHKVKQEEWDRKQEERNQKHDEWVKEHDQEKRKAHAREAALNEDLRQLALLIQTVTKEVQAL